MQEERHTEPQKEKKKSSRGAGKKKITVWDVLITIVLILILLIGIGFILYPTISDQWNRHEQAVEIEEYEQAVEQLIETLDENEFNRYLEEAERYNETLIRKPARFDMTEEEREEYSRILNVFGTGMIGYVEIPSLKISIPIYHGTDEEALQKAIGHLEGSSFPVGGKGTHAVLSGHRGLPSARLFTDIDQLAEGDIFRIRVLDRTVTYKVDQILTVLPDDLDALAIDPEEDYCTLMTCTPYGVNTHRLLVRGRRMQEDAAEETSEASAEESAEQPPKETAEEEGQREEERQPEGKILRVIQGLTAVAAVFILVLLIALLRKKKRRRDDG